VEVSATARGCSGLVDGGGDVGSVDRVRGVHGDGAAGHMDVDLLDAVEAAELVGDSGLAVRARHAGDLEGRGPDERAGGAADHGHS
jgi:hypothetical protein